MITFCLTYNILVPLLCNEASIITFSLRYEASIIIFYLHFHTSSAFLLRLSIRRFDPEGDWNLMLYMRTSTSLRHQQNQRGFRGPGLQGAGYDVGSNLARGGMSLSFIWPQTKWRQNAQNSLCSSWLFLKWCIIYSVASTTSEASIDERLEHE